jgi:hypothetical protein
VAPPIAGYLFKKTGSLVYLIEVYKLVVLSDQKIPVRLRNVVVRLNLILGLHPLRIFTNQNIVHLKMI